MSNTRVVLFFNILFFMLLHCPPWCGLVGAKGKIMSNALLVIFLFFYFVVKRTMMGPCAIIILF
jgi:hypothetical protein